MTPRHPSAQRGLGSSDISTRPWRDPLNGEEAGERRCALSGLMRSNITTHQRDCRHIASALGHACHPQPVSILLPSLCPRAVIGDAGEGLHRHFHSPLVWESASWTMCSLVCLCVWQVSLMRGRGRDHPSSPAPPHNSRLLHQHSLPHPEDISMSVLEASGWLFLSILQPKEHRCPKIF